MPNFLSQARMVPRVALLSTRAPRNPTKAWEVYWSRVQHTGAGGEVLWDSASDTEWNQYGGPIREHMDLTLPVIDVGCGNGTFTRRLAEVFPLALGVDVARSAVDRAEQESTGIARTRYRTIDFTTAGTGAALRSEYGPVNVFVRGVLHVLRKEQQRALARNLADLVGTTGRVLLTETNFRGNPLAYLQSLGASPGNIPQQLERAIAGIPVPGRFGARERSAAFPARDWHVAAEGPVTIEAVTMTSGGPTAIPGYFAMLRRNP
ncbi:class I SAM-dependent methyltransferase [Arthrobacter sp. Br18]|uniref:class I SAM-dependent methyltransferase n=1 Tax=Arthrobacter sp. Br18 TaxID=1312954 RepID=UPI00047DBAE8|nr:class I SAM-dependent methyltransferase [Arthrobacter sp. Br18]